MRRSPSSRFAPSRRLLVLALALIVGLLASSSARAAKGSESFVIVIGHNQSNDKGVRPLRYADDDALRYYELFSLVSKNVALFTVLDDDSARLHPKLARRARPPKLDSIMATLARYNRQMKALKAKGGRPELVFVYAGHGDIDKSGEGYVNLLRSKLRRRDLYRKVLAPSQASYVHLIIDACKSYFLVNRRGGWKNDAAPDTHDREIRAFLQKEDLSSYPNAGVILATSGSESTHEWSRYRAGILSYELRSALAGGADINGDGKVEYSEVHAFIAAANARVKNAKAKLNIWAKAPAADRHRPLFSVGSARRARLLRFGPQLAGHYHLEDDRGIRAADVNKASGLSFDLALDAHRSYYLRKAGSEARVPAGRKPLVVAQLGFGKPRLAARGSLDATFRRDLYAVAFSRGFYDGFVSRTGHIAVAAGTGTGAKLAAAPPTAPSVTPGVAAKQGKRATVAVLYFTYDGTDKELLVLKKGLAEMLITDLASLGTVRLVERMRLEAVLGELKLGRTKAIDKRSANRIGKLLGARYLVWGSYFKTFGAFCLTSKVIEVERGLTLPGGKACGKPADFLSLYKKVQTSLANTLETRLTVASAGSAHHPARATPQKRRARRKARAAKLAKRLPVRLTTQTALAYARALDAKDRGDTRLARRELKKLLREQPDFKQARVLLSSLR